eukprot:COSAG05_NODE_5480_length_1162_cov_11.470367_1_plen_47_part_01
MGYNYPAVFSWELGGEINIVNYSKSKELAAEFAPWSQWTKAVILYPS